LKLASQEQMNTSQANWSGLLSATSTPIKSSFPHCFIRSR